MSKNLNDLINDENSTEADILENIEDDDFVFVVSSAGQLKGISWPVDMDEDEEVDPAIEELITFLLDNFNKSAPPDSKLH